MGEAVERWLESRLVGVPEELAREVRRLACRRGRGSSEELTEALAAAALDALDEVAREDAGRDEALPLLAADALLTYAFEAAAESGADAAALACRIGLCGELGWRIADALDSRTPGGGAG